MSNFTHDYDHRDYIFLTPQHIGDTRDMSTMKERLARALFAKGEEIRRRADHEPRFWEDENVCRSLHFDLIAAILAEQIRLASQRREAESDQTAKRDWAGMIFCLELILDEPQQEDDAA